MVPFLYTAREHHGIRTAEDYQTAHAAFIAKKALKGARFAVHEDHTPVHARVDANTWLVDCSCGAGNATDPAWGVARCYGCGAVHTQVVFPDDHALIEALLVERAQVHRRGWDVGQTVVALIAENVSVSANVPVHVIEAVLADRALGGDA